jgi:hypothetical protein
MSNFDIDPNRTLENHPGLAGRLDELTEIIDGMLPENDRGEELARSIASLAISYFSEEILGEGRVVGGTDAAKIIGMSIAKTVRINQNGEHPKPIAHVGASRYPIWLVEDVDASIKLGLIKRRKFIRRR